MELTTLKKKIKVLEHAFAASAGAYYSINLTRNLVPGTMYQVIDDKEYSINEQIGMAEDARFSDVVAYWGRSVDEAQRAEYFAFFELPRLTQCYWAGQKHVSLRYWTKTALFEPMLAEQHIVMYTDEETGDLLAITYVLDLTQQHHEEQVRKRLQDSLEENLRLMHELQEKQKTLQNSLEALEKANIAKTDFLRRMSHDIRTPINGILGLLRINRNHCDDAALVRENEEKIEKAAHHLFSLIDDVLQMSKLESGTEEIVNTPVDLSEISRDITAMLRESAMEKGVAWEFSGDLVPDYPYLMTSALHLRQIFLNIYGNCIKFTKPGGTISTRQECLGKKGDTVTYRWTIRDTGIGMSEEFLKHIFDPFTQEHCGARSSYQGTGLGMTIVKGLIDKMGGTIAVSSKQGEGSVFVVTLPFAFAAAPMPPQPRADAAGTDLAGLHLLLAEDNALNVEIAQVLLTDAGAAVTVVTDGQQAVERFAQEAPGPLTLSSWTS